MEDPLEAAQEAAKGVKAVDAGRELRPLVGQRIEERRALILHEPDYIPNEVVGRTIMKGATPVTAWREHLGLTQAEVAAKLGISQGAYAKEEGSDKLR